MSNLSEFPLWFSGLRTQSCLHEGVGLIPDLTKDPALRILHDIASCSIDHRCGLDPMEIELRLTLSPGNSICHRCGLKKKKKKTKG